MRRNSKLSLALHLLGHMASDPKRALTSDVLAGFAETNPVVVRRTLGQLNAAGLVTSTRGHAGGWLLAQAPETITLASVYSALDERLSIGPREGRPNPPTCKIELAVGATFEEAMANAEAVLIEHLEACSLQDIATRRDV